MNRPTRFLTRIATRRQPARDANRPLKRRERTNLYNKLRPIIRDMKSHLQRTEHKLQRRDGVRNLLWETHRLFRDAMEPQARSRGYRGRDHSPALSVDSATRTGRHTVRRDIPVENSYNSPSRLPLGETMKRIKAIDERAMKVMRDDYTDNSRRSGKDGLDQIYSELYKVLFATEGIAEDLRAREYVVEELEVYYEAVQELRRDAEKLEAIIRSIRIDGGDAQEARQKHQAKYTAQSPRAQE